MRIEVLQLAAKNNKETISSVEKAIDILYFLSKAEMKSIRELSDAMDISKTTLHRILQTLETKKMVLKDDSSDKYYLGYKVLELGTNLINKNIIRDYALQYMKELSIKTGDTVQLAAVENNEIIVIDTVESNHQLRIFAKPGMKYPMSYGNFGKVFLAFSDIDDITQYISDVENREAYLKSIEQVRKDQVSIGIDTPIEGAISLAAPIFNSEKEIVASIAVLGVKTKQKLNSLDDIKNDIINCAKNISESIQ